MLGCGARLLPDRSTYAAGDHRGVGRAVALRPVGGRNTLAAGCVRLAFPAVRVGAPVRLRRITGSPFRPTSTAATRPWGRDGARAGWSRRGRIGLHACAVPVPGPAGGVTGPGGLDQAVSGGARAGTLGQARLSRVRMLSLCGFPGGMVWEVRSDLRGGDEWPAEAGRQDAFTTAKGSQDGCRTG